MAGIYIHIPFCKQACHYCNFHFSTTFESYRSQMVDAICQEIILRKNFFGTQKTNIQTIYFGGGTPSILTEQEFYQIWETLESCFNLEYLKEVTLEANPDDMDDTFFRFIQSSRIDRLSIGVQSLDNLDLAYLHRVHDSKKAIQSIETALKRGIREITTDLIFGIPTSGISRLEKDIRTLSTLGVNHISVYGLTVESRTPLAHLIAKKKALPVDEEKSIEEMLWLMDFMPGLGYEQYEISNFAVPGFEAVHNSSYWNDMPYLGIGPSAHSYMKPVRSWNVANNMTYIRSVQKDILPSESEVLDTETLFNEWVMTHLRLREGISVSKLKQQYGIFLQAFKSNIQPFVAAKDVLFENGRYVLTKKGKLITDYITSELFV